MPTLTAIVAMTPERIIGRDGTLPWHLPEDFKFFKRTTTGHSIVMGRKTFDSIGKPLPNRRNIVLTRDTAWSAPSVETIHRPEDLLSLLGADEHAYIIGGAEIYTAYLPHLTDLLISHVHAHHPGDTSFPEFQHLFPHFKDLETHPDFTIRHWTK